MTRLILCASPFWLIFNLLVANYCASHGYTSTEHGLIAFGLFSVWAMFWVICIIYDIKQADRIR